MSKQISNHVLAQKAIPLVLRQVSPIWRPFVLNDEYNIDSITFFQNGQRIAHVSQGWFDYVETDQGIRCGGDHTIERLNFLIPCLRKTKIDLTLNIAFYVPTKREKGWGRKYADLYIPLDCFVWQTKENVVVHQHEKEQTVYNAIVIKRPLLPIPDSSLNVGILIESGIRPITAEMAKQEEAKQRIETLEQPLRKIIASYVENRQFVRKERKRLETEKTNIEKQLKELDKNTRWWGSMLEEIAVEMLKEPELQEYQYAILGPFGLSAETSIHFSKIGNTRENHFEGLRSLTFRPGETDAGELRLVDHTFNTHEYQDGSIGEMNGANYRTIELKTSIRGLIDFMLEPEKKEVHHV